VLFTKQFGIAPLAYRNGRRMLQAMELVRSSRLSVKQIAQKMGFRHATHLSAMFRRAFGLTVSEAMRRYRQA
jgi:AraC-like DNA-binding protein